MDNFPAKIQLKHNILTASAIFAAILFILLTLTGCENRTASSKDVEFLTASECWYHYDEVTGESEKMSFSDDFTFYWGCICGEPVGNSDCYELFDYDKETSIIRLYNDYDDMSMELEVLDYSDYHLLLKIDNKIKNYTYSETGLDVTDNEKYMEGYSGEFTFLDGNTEEIVLGPFDYDGDIAYPDNAKKTYKLSDDVKIYTLFTFTQIKDGQEIENTVDYKEIDIKEALYHIEYGGYGFIWFDDNMQISKILFYGATIAEE